MERNREARRSTMVAPSANAGSGGGGLSRRRQRNNGGFRDSPEEDGKMEMPETSRLRDRGPKKDRDRDRSSRSKRRRGERMLHGSNRDRDEADESSEESIDQDEDDEDEDLSVLVRLPPASPPLPNPVAASSPQPNQQHSHHHHQQQLLRKSFPPKIVKWKADEMIGVTVPRKARSASTKRPHEPAVLGGGGGTGSGSGEQINRQASVSPSRLSPASNTQLSPSSSNGSLRKKMKPISGARHRPPKISKSTPMIQDEIEIEVAEVLFGMTRQFECHPKQDIYKLETRHADGASGNEAKSRVPSPSSLSPSTAAYSSALPLSNSCPNPAPLPTIAPKRKKPRPVKFDEENPTSAVGLHNLPSLSLPSVAKVDSENQIKTEASSPGSEKNSAFPAIRIGGGPVDVLVSQAGPSDAQQQEPAKTEKKAQDLHSLAGASNIGDRVENKDDLASPAKGSLCTILDANVCETTARKIAPDSPKEEKFKIDLMAPPPGKLSPQGDDSNDFEPDHKAQGPDIEMVLKINKEKAEEKPAESTLTRDDQPIDKSVQKDVDLKKQAVIKQNLGLQLDMEKPKKDDSFDKVQIHKQQAKDPKVEPKHEKSASTSSLHMPLTVGTWPGGFPPYGYMGQMPFLQAVVPMDGAACTSSSLQSLQPPAFLQMHPHPKHCARHCHIAQMISNHQKFARMNCFWTATAAATPGSFLGANMGALQESKGAPALAASYTGNTPQEKMISASNTIIEAAQRKPLILQQMPQPGSTNNMAPGPACVFPVNQQQAAAAANRAGGAKSTTGSGAEVRNSGASSSAVGSCAGGGSAAPVNLSFTSLPPNEAQYLAFLQNNAYPFPIPAHFAGAPPFRGSNNAQAIPFFYPSHMLHPSQMRPQQQQPAGPLSHVQQNHQNPSTLSGSSSQKHSQQSSNGFSSTNQRQDLLPQQTRPKESNKGMEDGLPTTDAALAMGNGGGHSDKQPIYQQAQQKQKVELTPLQAFTIPFASFGGPRTAPPGLDFSSLAQNHAILQSLPETSRHGYYQIATAAVAAAAQAVEHKKVHQASEDGKSVARESMNTNMTGEEDRQTMVAGKGPQHSLSFAKADGEPPISSVLSNNIIDISSRSINLFQVPANGSRSTDRSSGTSTATTSVLAASTVVGHSQQQQQHLIHLQKHQQQQLMQHHLASSRSKPLASSNNSGIQSESLPGGSTITKFPHAPTGFPQALVQGGSPIQWPQGKTSAGRAVEAAAASPTPVVKNNLLQLQGRAAQQSLTAQSHQTQISFGMTANKAVPPGGHHLSGAFGSPSSAAIAVGSPSNSVSKSAGGSPSTSNSLKPSPQTSAILLTQQSTMKQSASTSSSKSITVGNPNMPSILGHPQKVPAPSSNTKQQQQPQQQKQQTFPEAQLFFSNPHMQQVQCAQSSASTPAAQYYQKRQPEQQTRQSLQQQQHSLAASTGMLSLCASSALAHTGVPATSDPAKALTAASVAAANSMKGLPPPNYINAAQLAVAAQTSTGSPRPAISATFPYMSLPSFSMKPSAEQKSAAGSDNLHACWQPEKR